MFFATGMVSAASLWSILMYMDPYQVGTSQIRWISIILLISTFMLTVISFLSLILYFFKKIYYRGDVGMYHIVTSIRQSTIFTSALVGIGVFSVLWMNVLLPGIVLLLMALILELFIQNF